MHPNHQYCLVMHGHYLRTAGSSCTKEWYMFLTTKTFDLTSFVPITTINWLDIQVLVRLSITFDSNSTGPTSFDSSWTMFYLAQPAIKTSPSITSHLGPTDSSLWLFNLGTLSSWTSLKDSPYPRVMTRSWSSFVTCQKWASSFLQFKKLMLKISQ